MAGLLQSPANGARKFVVAVAAEFIASLLFALYGNATPSQWGPWGNGITLAVLVYITANVSGGHINPAVTFSTILTGHINFTKGLCYIVAQIGGACIGTLLMVPLTIGATVGMGNNGPGCFTPNDGQAISLAQAFGWEAIMTFVLVSTVYAVAVGEPSFGNIGPFAIGLALWASGFIGSQYTGTALNPSRVLGTSIVFDCYWSQAWVYILAEFAGAFVAGLCSWPLYGTGPSWRNFLGWMGKGPGSRHFARKQHDAALEADNRRHAAVRNGLGKVEGDDQQRTSDVNWHQNPAAGTAGAFGAAKTRDQGHAIDMIPHHNGPASQPHGPQFIPGPPNGAGSHDNSAGGFYGDEQQRLRSAGAPARPMTAADVPRHIALEIIEASNQEGYMVSSSMPNMGQPGLKGGGRGVLTDRPGATAQQLPLVPGVL